MISPKADKKKRTAPNVTFDQLRLASNVFALTHSAYILFKLIKLAIKYNETPKSVILEWSALSLLPTLTAVQSLMLFTNSNNVWLQRATPVFKLISAVYLTFFGYLSFLAMEDALLDDRYWLEGFFFKLVLLFTSAGVQALFYMLALS